MTKEGVFAACVLLLLPIATMVCVCGCDLIYRRSCRREEYRRVLKERALDRYWRWHVSRRARREERLAAALKEREGGAE